MPAELKLQLQYLIFGEIEMSVLEGPFSPKKVLLFASFFYSIHILILSK